MPPIMNLGSSTAPQLQRREVDNRHAADLLRNMIKRREIANQNAQFYSNLGMQHKRLEQQKSTMEKEMTLRREESAKSRGFRAGETEKGRVFSREEAEKAFGRREKAGIASEERAAKRGKTSREAAKEFQLDLMELKNYNEFLQDEGQKPISMKDFKALPEQEAEPEFAEQAPGLAPLEGKDIVQPEAMGVAGLRQERANLFNQFRATKSKRQRERINNDLRLLDAQIRIEEKAEAREAKKKIDFDPKSTLEDKEAFYLKTNNPNAANKMRQKIEALDTMAASRPDTIAATSAKRITDMFGGPDAEPSEINMATKKGMDKVLKDLYKIIVANNKVSELSDFKTFGVKLTPDRIDHNSVDMQAEDLSELLLDKDKDYFDPEGYNSTEGNMEFRENTKKAMVEELKKMMIAAMSNKTYKPGIPNVKIFAPKGAEAEARKEALKDAALYSNPFTAVPKGLYDVGRSFFD